MIRNRIQLVENGLSQDNRKARRHVLDALDEALISADPAALMLKKARIARDTLRVGRTRFNLRRFQRIVVIGGGKASAGMAEALEKLLGNRITAGLVAIPTWLHRPYKTELIELCHTTHPLPSVNGVNRVSQMLELVGKPSKDTMVVCLFSGGGSSLMPLPRKGIRLHDKIATTDLLLKSGANIEEINVVRKHLSQFKGGWLAKELYPCTTVVFVISDVVGNALDTIASGPAHPDPSTFQDGLAILTRYRLTRKVPKRVIKTFQAGVEGLLEETPKPGDRCFSRVHHFIVGSNRDASEGAIRKLRVAKCLPLRLNMRLKGEAQAAGTSFANVMKEAATRSKTPLSSVIGGETTVTVVGRGVGGRSQEAALSAATNLAGTTRLTMAFIGTDGMDGPTDAAGAIVDSHTIDRARAQGLEPSKYLLDNDSYTLFERLGDLIFTGPTGTNVGDLAVGVRC